jgi:hypothetical protein
MTQRYFARWQVAGQGQGVSYIKIYDFENTAFGWGFSSSDPQKLTIAGDSVTLEYQGREDNIFEPIKTSTLTVKLVIENENQAKIVEAARLTKEFNLGIEFGYEISGSSVPQWHGVLAPQSVQVDYGINPYGASLTFTDGLSLLDEISYRAPNGDPYEDHVPLLLHLQRCFQYLPTLPLYGSAQILFEYVTNIYHDNHDLNASVPQPPLVGPDMDVLYRTACSGKTFYQEEERDNYFNNLFLVKRKTMSCLAVVKSIMTTMQLTLCQRSGKYMAYSNMPYLTQTGFMTDYRYFLNKNAVANLTFAPGTKVASADAGHVIQENTYDVMVGSKEGILPPAAGVTYVHKGGGSSSVFPRAQSHIFSNINFTSTLAYTAPHGNLGDFTSGGSGTVLGDFPKIDNEVEVPSGTGFRMRGRVRLRVRNPRNDFLNDVSDPVSRGDEMIGAKLIVRMKIKVGSYYLRQTVSQLSASDFTDETDWGAITTPVGAPGASAAAPNFYYPIEHGDAEWTQNSADRFSFMVLHPDFTSPAVETLEYDDENGVITEYPLGLYLKRDGDNVNKARYTQASYNEWLGEGALQSFIYWLDAQTSATGNNSQYPNPVVESNIDLSLPALPAAAGDQVGMEIDCEIQGYTSEGYLLYNTDVSAWPSPSTNYSWLGNVLVAAPSFNDFEFFIGDGGRSYNPMFSAEDDNPEGTEDLQLGSTVLGSRYDSVLGSLGFLTTALFDENGDYTGSGTFNLGWNSVSLPQNQFKGVLQVCANVAMNYYGSAKRQFNLILTPRLSNAQLVAGQFSGAAITPGSLFYFEREGLTLLIQKATNNLHKGTVDLLAVELDHDPRVITEYDNTELRGITGGGMAPAPGGQGFSHRIFVESRSRGRSLTSDNVTKLDFINLNATSTGVDTITGFSGGGSGLTQEQIDKLAAITLDSAGTSIADFTVNGTPLTADEIEDSSSTHKFATQAELNTISANSASVNDILTVFKETTTGDGAGVYVNTSSTTESHVSVTSTTGKLQAGTQTSVDIQESSPGTIDLNVQSGQAGSEQQVTALSISGSSTSLLPTLTINGAVNHGRDWNFTNSGSTVTFTAATSGIDYGDLDNPPTTITAAERAKLSGLTKYHGVLLDGASGGTGIGSGTISMAVGDRFACKGTVASDGFYEVTTAFTWTQGANETDGQLEFNAEYNNFQVVASAADIGLADLAASSATDSFNDSLASFSLTTSGATTFQALVFLVQGITSFIGNVGVTGNITVSGTVDGIDIATDVSANTAKVSFPGFGTTSGTALEGNTAIPSATSDLTNDLGFITSANELDGVYLEVKTRTAAYGSGAHEGQIIKYGTGTLSAGKVYVLRDNGGAALWDEADADAEIQTKGLLGMALGTSPTTNGLLVRGIRSYSNSFTVGAPLYISLTAGQLTDDLSSHTTGDFVRAVGYSLSTTLIYIDPSPDFIELG